MDGKREQGKLELPGQCIFLQRGDGDPCQAEGGTVESGGLLEGPWWNGQVYVGNSSDHFVEFGLLDLKI